MEIIDKHLLTQIRLLYKCACKDIYVKYLVTYLEGTQQTTINPYELIVIPDGKSNSDYTRNLPSVFLIFFSAKTQKNDHRPDVAYYAVKQLIYFRYNIFINVLPAFLEMVCNKFCIFFQSDRLLIQNHSTLIKSQKTYKNFSRHMTL